MTTRVPDGGPRPARDDRPVGAALELLRALAVAPGPLTISQLKAGLGGHPNRFRLPLEHLVADGFVEETANGPAGRGRPARSYVATPVGAQVALEHPGRRLHIALVEAVAESMADDPDRRATARTLGRSWGRRLPGTGLVAALAAQGFAPKVEPDQILLRTCPMLAAARKDPDVVCSIHQGMVDSVGGDGLLVVPFADPDGCVVRGLPRISQRRDLSCIA